MNEWVKSNGERIRVKILKNMKGKARVLYFLVIKLLQFNFFTIYYNREFKNYLEIR